MQEKKERKRAGEGETIINIRHI